MATEPEGTSILVGNPNQWADHSKNRSSFDYDANSEVEKWWVGDGRELIEVLAGVHGDDTSHDSSQDEGEEGIVNESHGGTSFPSLFPLFLSINFTVSSIATLGCYVVTNTVTTLYRSRQSEGKRRGCAHILDVSPQCHGSQVGAMARVVNNYLSHNHRPLLPDSVPPLPGSRVFKLMLFIRDPASNMFVESPHGLTYPLGLF